MKAWDRDREIHNKISIFGDLIKEAIGESFVPNLNSYIKKNIKRLLKLF